MIGKFNVLLVIRSNCDISKPQKRRGNYVNYVVELNDFQQVDSEFTYVNLRASIRDRKFFHQH